MDFISHNIKSINFPNLNLEFKKYPDITVPISIIRSKNYPYISFYQTVFLDKNKTIAPKSSHVISISPAGVVFKVGTAFRIDKSLEKKALMQKALIVGMPLSQCPSY